MILCSVPLEHCEDCSALAQAARDIVDNKSPAQTIYERAFATLIVKMLEDCYGK